jgi:hypothetical protein
MTRIIIFGCGGIGGYVGGMLSRSAAAVHSSPNDACSSAGEAASSRRHGAAGGGGGSCEITMVDAWAEHVDAMKAAGLGITCGLRRGTFTTVRVRALHLHEVSCAVVEALPLSAPPVPLGCATQPLALRWWRETRLEGGERARAGGGVLRTASAPVAAVWSMEHVSVIG